MPKSVTLKVLNNHQYQITPQYWIEANAINPLTDKPIKLLKYQRDLLNKMFSPVGIILTPNLFMFGTKKTGKSALAAMIAMYRLRHFRNNQIVCMANMEEQAQIIKKQAIELFREARFFKKLKIKMNSIEDLETKSEIRIITKSRSASHGMKIDMLIADEIMEYDDKCFSVFNVCLASQSLSQSPQTICISNVPLHPDHKSLELLKRYKKNKKKWNVVQFKANQKYSWTSKKGWASANPFYKEYKNVRENYANAFKEALQDKDKELAFRMWFLGTGHILDGNNFIDSKNIKWIAKPKKQEEILQNREIEWTSGWDLSLSGHDSSSWVMAGWIPNDDMPLEDQKLYLIGNIYYGNIDKKQKLIKDKIRKWHLDGLLSLQNKEVIQHLPIIGDFNNLMDRYPHIKEQMTCVFDPSFAQNFIQELQDDYVCITRTYSPKFMTRPIRQMQRIAELKNINILEAKNEAIEWQASCGAVNQMSRNWCMLGRLNKNPQVNVDYWSAALLALSQLLESKPAGEVLVL